MTSSTNDFPSCKKYKVVAQKLLFSFDASALKADLAKLMDSNWIQHYNTKDHQGSWNVLPLRSIHGHSEVIHATPSIDMYKATALLSRCTYFQRVISTFKCPLGSVRLMRLKAGAKILEHTDDMGTGSSLSFRIHIPIQTNSAVHFWIDQQRFQMQEGKVWWGNFNLPHRVENQGVGDRIHMVLDGLHNKWLEKQIHQAIDLQDIS